MVASLFFLVGGFSAAAPAEPTVSFSKIPEKIIIDTDIGTDIDDAFAVALALRSPEFDILGIATASGDTESRAKILDRMLGEVGREDIPVAVGIQTPLPAGATVNQKVYGEKGHFARPTHPNAVDFILDQIRRYPGEITLVAIGPLSNLGGVIDKNPQTFRKLKRVVMMGGQIETVKPDYGHAAALVLALSPEYNVLNDIGAAQKVFLSGIPLFVMPIDSTQHLALDEVKRSEIFAEGTPITESLEEQYTFWNHELAPVQYGAVQYGVTPVLYDAMTLAYILEPSLCPVRLMQIRVDDKGLTRVESGTPNAQVCLHSDADAFFRFYMRRLLAQ